MKCTIATLAFFSLIAVRVFAQIPVTISSDVDPGTLIDRINQAERFAQTIENAIQQLQTAAQALQYQIQTLQQLDKGTWSGFVQAWNNETQAINGYVNLVAQMPSLSDISAVSNLVQTQGYKAALTNLRTLQSNWGLASNVVHTTDTLVTNTSYRQQLWSQTQANSANSQSTVGQLQTLNQALGLLGGEVQDVNMNLGAWKTYWVAQVEQEQIQRAVQQQEADDFVEGDTANQNWTPQEPAWETMDAQYQSPLQQ